jgi:hypothetical protein
MCRAAQRAFIVVTKIKYQFLYVSNWNRVVSYGFRNQVGYYQVCLRDERVGAIVSRSIGDVQLRCDHFLGQRIQAIVRDARILQNVPKLLFIVADVSESQFVDRPRRFISPFNR